MPQLLNMLTWWQWSILAVIPLAIISLYFLKLKRRPVEVPSTYLWRRSVEDMHVNTIWQRLRRNILLLLQLLLLLLLMFALLRPGWRGTTLTGDRFIFLVDNSASMRATDVKPTRLDEAKQRVRQLIGQMDSDDVAMIVSFSDVAKVEQTFTGSRSRLRKSLNDIRATGRTTSLFEAIKVVAGLTKSVAGRTEDLAAKVYIFTDGKFDDVVGVSLGSLETEVVVIGEPEPDNVGIVTFSVARHTVRAEMLQAFAQVENFGRKAVSTTVDLYLNEQLIDAAEFKIAANETESISFDLGEVDSGTLTLKLNVDDQLTLDNEARAVITPPRRARVLLVTQDNEPLRIALESKKIATLTVEPPDVLDTKEYRNKAIGRAYDLIVYDRCRPKEMPQANTLFIGQLPPAPGWSAKQKVDVPQIIDVDPKHPLTQWLDLGDVVFAECTILSVPKSGSTLIDTNAGPILAIAPRERFEDVVLGAAIVEQVPGNDGKTVNVIRTNWPIRASFPTFFFNVLEYFGGRGKEMENRNARPDTMVELNGGGGGRFAVNLLCAKESDIGVRPDEAITIGNSEILGQSNWVDSRREIWQWLLLAGLGVLLLEWYVYNRRVYL